MEKSANPPEAVARLDDVLWNFRDVPDEQLSACWRWEVGREVATSAGFREWLRNLGITIPAPKDFHISALPMPLIEAGATYAPLLLGIYTTPIPWRCLTSEAALQFSQWESPEIRPRREFQAALTNECMFRIIEDSPSQTEPKDSHAAWVFDSLAFGNGDRLTFDGFKNAASEIWDVVGEPRTSISYGAFSICWEWTVEETTKRFKSWLKAEHARRGKDRRKGPRGGPKEALGKLNALGALRCKQHYGRKYLQAIENRPGDGAEGVNLNAITPFATLGQIDKGTSAATRDLRKLAKSIGLR